MYIYRQISIHTTYVWKVTLKLPMFEEGRLKITEIDVGKTFFWNSDLLNRYLLYISLGPKCGRVIGHSSWIGTCIEHTRTCMCTHTHTVSPSNFEKYLKNPNIAYRKFTWYMKYFRIKFKVILLFLWTIFYYLFLEPYEAKQYRCYRLINFIRITLHWYFKTFTRKM